MVIESSLERDCHLLGTVFTSVISELKNSNGAWEDLLSKASKLQSAVKNSCSALSGFLDALQKIADMATNAKGATREIGSSLTRLCLRHRTLEQRLRELTNKMQDHLIGPMQNNAEDWRRVAFAIDKDHTREIKRARQDLKRLTNEALKAQKKAKKGNLDAQFQLDQLFQELSDRYAVLETLQRTALRVALREERARYCYFISCLKPMMEEEVAILDERNNVREILDLLSSQSLDPENLPEASEQAIRDLQGHQVRVWEVLRTKVAAGHIDDTVGSDGGSLSRKSSSLCSIDDDEMVSNDGESDDEHGLGSNSVNGGGCGGGGTNGQTQQAIQHGVINGMGTATRSKIQRKLSEVLTTSARMSAATATAIGGSYDSGFMSQPEHQVGALMYGMVANGNGNGGDNASGGSPESEPGLVMTATKMSQQMVMNGSSTMRPHTISAAAYHQHGQHQRSGLSQAVFDPPQQQQDGDVNGSATLLRLSKPVPPPRIPIRLNALDQPVQPVAVGGSANGGSIGSDSISLSNSDYAPIYANANELQIISQQHYIQQQYVTAQQPGRRHRSASSSSNDHYLELQPIGNGQQRTRTPQPIYSTHQQLRVQPDEQSLAFAMQQLECTVTQLSDPQQQPEQFYQTPDGMIYAAVPMPRQPQQQLFDNTGTIRRAPSSNGGVNGSLVKPTPPTRRGSSEQLSLVQTNGRQQMIYQQPGAVCSRLGQPPPPPPTQHIAKSNSLTNRAQLTSSSAAAVAAVVEHALAVGSAHHQNGQHQVVRSSPQSLSKANGRPPHLQLQQQLQQQLNQAITQRSALSSAPQQRLVDNSVQSGPSSQPQLTQPFPAPPPSQPTNKVVSSPPVLRQTQLENGCGSGGSSSSGNGSSASPSSPSSPPPSSPQQPNSNLLLTALQSKRQQLRKTVANDRSAPKVGR